MAKSDVILREQVKVLDHGFIEVLDVMGDDSDILEAARISTGSAPSKGEEQDAKLIDYLMRNRHTSPFEMCEIKFRVKLPIFVARQWIRHRTANVNEMSGRYTKLPSEFFIPSVEDVRQQSKTNNQGGVGQVDQSNAATFVNLSTRNSDKFCDYDWALNAGITRELARINLPLSTYTAWVWKIDLHNLLHFLKLRFDSHAQTEIRVYAEIMRDIVARWVPMTYASWKRRVRADALSAQLLWNDADISILADAVCELTESHYRDRVKEIRDILNDVEVD